MKYISNSVEETIAIGVKLAVKLKKGDVVALIGDLGAGKTVLTKGIAKGLKVKDVRYVNSPTFVIIKEYKGRLSLYHFDLYRLDGSSIIDAESYEEYFYGSGVTVIEWADKIEGLLPKKYVKVKLSVLGEEKRKIEIENIK
ncbi:MAG: tRNA (adenosine(37)-N6)-threonylcarbamoyltransferase complex ATPase subunit type 1 TsaE [Candidatus Omnitrophica bacterium]|nr:tRNA (adenosine(37)-N6)-threonylcarbamoyltransferase complex ATPase subunit type 1 TsaE [Candidatus Omnitrophota bacterium]